MFGISGGEAIIILIVALVIINNSVLMSTLRLDWRKLDPRQYDPRVIVREALLEDDEEQNRHQYEASTVAAPTVRRLARGERAPFDTEAT